MEKENEFLTAIREADRLNKEDEDAYIKKFEEFAKMIESGNFKIQGEDEQDD